MQLTPLSQLMRSPAPPRDPLAALLEPFPLEVRTSLSGRVVGVWDDVRMQHRGARIGPLVMCGEDLVFRGR